MLIHKYTCPNCEEDFESRREGRKFCSMPCAAEAKTKKLTCKRGHTLTPENTYLYKGRRTCQTCKNASAKRCADRNPEKEAERGRNHRKNNPKMYSERAKRWYRNNPERVRERHLSQYGISLAEFEELKELQKGVCAICEQEQEKELAVDHDHRTGAIRGLLCSNCNSGLGFMKDSPSVLKRATVYLEDSIKERTHV